MACHETNKQKPESARNMANVASYLRRQPLNERHVIFQVPCENKRYEH